MCCPLARLGRWWQAGVVLAVAIAWPIAHIGNIAALAVPVNVALVVAFGSVAWQAERGGRRSTHRHPPTEITL